MSWCPNYGISRVTNRVGINKLACFWGLLLVHIGLYQEAVPVNQKVNFYLAIFPARDFPCQSGRSRRFSTFMGGGWPRCSWKEQNEGVQTSLFITARLHSACPFITADNAGGLETSAANMKCVALKLSKARPAGRPIFSSDSRSARTFSLPSLSITS